MTEPADLQLFGTQADALQAQIDAAEARGEPVQPAARAMLAALRELTGAIAGLNDTLAAERAAHHDSPPLPSIHWTWASSINKVVTAGVLYVWSRRLLSSAVFRFSDAGVHRPPAAMRSMRSTAAGETAAVARPGGAISAFCEPETTTSRPHSSISSGTAPRLETASTTTSAPASFATAARD